MTKTEEIVARMAQILAAAGINVRDDTDALFSFENKPVIVLDTGNETPRGVVGGGLVYWDLSVSLLIGADGDSPKLAPEPTRKAAHEALYADRSLGALVIDITASQINRSIDAENPAGGITEAVYSIQYRQSESTV